MRNEQIGSVYIYIYIYFFANTLMFCGSFFRRNYYLRQPICNSWNRHCLPWSNEIQHSCCGGLACKCNLWGQNCRCTTQLWGRWLDSHLHVTEILFDFHGFPFRTSRLGMNKETFIRNRLFIFCFLLNCYLRYINKEFLNGICFVSSDLIICLQFSCKVLQHYVLSLT